MTRRKKRAEIAIIGGGAAGLHLLDVLLARDAFNARFAFVFEDDSSAADRADADVATRQSALPALRSDIEITTHRHLADLDHFDLVVIATESAAPTSNDATPVMSRDRVVEASKRAPAIERIIEQLGEELTRTVVLVLDDPAELLVTAACVRAIEVAGARPEDAHAAHAITSRILAPGAVHSSRVFRQLLAARLDVHLDDIQALIIGERRRIEIPLWSTCTIGGTPLHRYRPKGKRPLSVRDRVSIFEPVRDGAVERDARGGTAHFADALAAAEIIDCILNDERRLMTPTVWQGDFVSPEPDEAGDRRPCAFARPAIIGREGVERVIDEWPLNDNERAAQAECARSIRAACRDLKSRAE